jgi:hypothetical protein
LVPAEILKNKRAPYLLEKLERIWEEDERSMDLNRL